MRQPDRGVLAGRILNEQYVVIGLLRAGGMAEVYRGDDLALERDVAVKVLPRAASDDPTLVARFRDEARRVAALNHPRIVPIYHLGQDGDLVYIVMPLMRGSLRDLLYREGTFPPAEAARLVQQVAQALEVAHAAGIVHRDVKPENILLDADGNAHLSDFGIARSFTGNGTVPTIPSLANGGIPAGTPQYMAPEQLAGEPLDQRADVYGLAAVLYELLSGEPPHGMGPLPEVIGRAIAGGIPPLAPRAPAVWPQLEAAVAKGLTRDRAQRYQTVHDFSQALHAAMSAQGQRPTPPADLSALPTISAAAGAAYAAATRLASGTPVSPVASTVPQSQLTDPAVTDGISRPRRLAVAIALVALLALLTAASSAYYLAATDHPTAGHGGATGSAATATARAVSTGSPARGTATQAATPPASSSTPSATATTPAPTATPTLSVAVTPQPFILRGAVTCSGTQTVTNNSAQPINWSWSSSSSPLLFQYAVSGSGKTPSGTSMPFTRDGEPAGATDQITVQMACGQSATIHFTAALAGDSPQPISFDFQLAS